MDSFFTPIPLILKFIYVYIGYSFSLFVVRKFFKIKTPKFKDLYKPTLLSLLPLIVVAIFPSTAEWLFKIDTSGLMIPVLMLLLWFKFKKVKLSLKNAILLSLITAPSIFIANIFSIVLIWILLEIGSNIGF